MGKFVARTKLGLMKKKLKERLKLLILQKRPILRLHKIDWTTGKQNGFFRCNNTLGVIIYNNL